MLHMVLLHLNTRVRKVLGSHTWECAPKMHSAFLIIVFFHWEPVKSLN